MAKAPSSRARGAEARAGAKTNGDNHVGSMLDENAAELEPDLILPSQHRQRLGLPVPDWLWRLAVAQVEDVGRLLRYYADAGRRDRKGKDESRVYSRSQAEDARDWLWEVDRGGYPMGFADVCAILGLDEDAV